MSQQLQIESALVQIGLDVRQLRLDAKTYENGVYAVDENYIYSAHERVDGAGYRSQRVELATGALAGEAFNPLPIPADLAALSYS